MASSFPRAPAVNLSSSPLAPSDMYHRSSPSLRPSSPIGLSALSNKSSPRSSPLLPSASNAYAEKTMNGGFVPANGLYSSPESQNVPRICGMPLKYVSLVTLAVQNAALSIVMHYSRVSMPPALAYSPASAVLFNEILKGSISFTIALLKARNNPDIAWQRKSSSGTLRSLLYMWVASFSSVCSEIFSPDCWKLSIPAILYVVQNSLQFVAISNLPVASFQVMYQMKILTTAAFSVAMLRKRLSSTKWISLFFLAIGVGIVQIQTSSAGHSAPKHTTVGSAHDYHVHIMNPLKGFGAVTAACFTSGLAGVYFEMVLKNSKSDLWVRNVQLSLFSLVPALLPILYAKTPDSQGFVSGMFRNFGAWAWATVAIQVLGGLITAVVIKYSDNILKGFATSLSIVLSFLASVVLFDFHITLSFIVGASTVLTATWMYNQPASKEPLIIVGGGNVLSSGKATPFPVDSSEPILGQSLSSTKKSSPFGSPRVIASALGFTGHSSRGNGVNGGANGTPDLVSVDVAHFGETLDTARYHQAPYGSPYASKAPSRVPSRVSTPNPPSPLTSEREGLGVIR